MNSENSHNFEITYSFETHLSNKLEKPVLIYGAGNFGKDVFQCLTQSGIQIIAFLDRKANPGSQWNGVSIHTPDWQGLSVDQKKQVVVVIAIHNREVAIPPIIAQLELLGYRHFIHPIELYDSFSEKLGDRFWLTSRNSYLSWRAEIEECLALWEDPLSRDLYQALLKFRIQGDAASLPMPDLERQYFPNDIPAWSTPIRFIDCGAYDGDTLLIAQKLGIRFETAVLFEPDLTNFNKLSQWIASEWEIPIFCWPCGVHSSTCQLQFSGDGGEGGKVSMNGNTTIQAVALDDVLHSYRPTLIKMDIEGAEIEALMGAKRMIRENKPGLAISIYHHPRHLWQIPLLVKKWGLGYRFYLRLHGHNGFESVMYAIPGEK